MANEKYFPFRSVSGDRKYSADDWAAYFALFLGNGVFYSSADRLKVTAYDGMKVKVQQGAGFIGGRMYMLETEKIFTLDTADGVLNRIDRIVLRCDYANRKISTEVLKGSYSAEPTAPELTRDADVYELALADVYVAAGVITITAANITDQRLNTALCGIVTGLIKQADTTEIFNQFQAYMEEFEEAAQAEFSEWFEEVRIVLSDDVAGNLYVKIEDVEQGLENRIENEVAALNKSISEETAERTKEVAVERARIDKLVTSGSSVSGYAELRDIRVKADGTTAETAGAAVREQINQLYNDKVDKNGVNQVSCENADFLVQKCIFVDKEELENLVLLKDNDKISFKPSEGYTSYLLNVKPNTQYSIIMRDSDTGSYFRVATYTYTYEKIKEYYEKGYQIKNNGSIALTKTNIKNVTVTTGSEDITMLVCIGDYTKEPQIIEGEFDTEQDERYQFSEAILFETIIPKKIAWLGDSISKLKTLPHDVGKMLQSEVFDCSVAGSVMCKQTEKNINYETLGFVEISKAIASGDFSAQEQAVSNLVEAGGTGYDENLANLKSVNFSTVDYLVALYGTNDWTHGVITLEEFKNLMSEAIERILTKYPHIKMYFISPIYRVDGTRTNSQNKRLYDYVAAEKEVCEAFNIPFYDLYRGSNINSITASYYLNADGLHQNEIGNSLLAEKCYKFLKAN